MSTAVERARGVSDSGWSACVCVPGVKETMAAMKRGRAKMRRMEDKKFRARWSELKYRGTYFLPPEIPRTRPGRLEALLAAMESRDEILGEAAVN
jgi:hypothetical protein